MQNKLQELTDRLYNEGLSRGKEEGDAILAAAKAHAAEIIAEAKAEAEGILKDAENHVSDIKSKAESDIKMAALQTIQAVRTEIADAIVVKMTDLQVDKALSSDEFAKEVIRAVAANFSSETSGDLELILPETLKESLEPFVKNELSASLGKGLDVSFNKKIGGGLRISPKDGSYYVSMTNETFRSLLYTYLRPATRKILFGI